jgi:hypothetical protein
MVKQIVENIKGKYGWKVKKTPVPLFYTTAFTNWAGMKINCMYLASGATNTETTELAHWCCVHGNTAFLLFHLLFSLNGKYLWVFNYSQQ